MEQKKGIADSKLRTYYQSKGDASFGTKLNLYLFDKIIYNRSPYLDLNEFIAFEISKPLVDQYSTVYWQMEKDFIIDPCGLSCDAIYNKISQLIRINPKKIEELRIDYITNQFPKIFNPEDFIKLLNQDHCEYCKITLNEINDLADKRQLRKKNLRGWTLEIDRLDSNVEYKPDNCVMACYWCNNAKTDEFTAEEFREVGKVIRNIWDKRLKG